MKKHRNTNDGALRANISPECYRKINRIINISASMERLVRGGKFHPEPLLWLPDILGYINDDAHSILDELKTIVVCDRFIKVRN